MSFADISRTTSGMISLATVDVVGIMTFTTEVAKFGIVVAGELPEIAERMNEPETSPTWISLMARLFIFFNN